MQHALGRHDEARKTLDDVIVLAAAQKTPVLGETLHARATIELDTKHWARAIAFEERSIATIEVAGGVNAPGLWLPLSGLARAKLEVGDAKAAVPLLERALAVATQAHVTDTELAPVRALLDRARR